MRAIRLREQVAEVLGERAQVEGPVVEPATFRRPRLEPKPAVLLVADVAPDASPDEIARSVSGVLVAIDIVEEAPGSGGFVLGEQLHPLDSGGELRLWMDGELVAARPMGEPGDRLRGVARTASAIGGLRAGDVVLLGDPAAGAPAAPGVLLLEGPHGGVLSAKLRYPA